jgi:hypothetical protein
MGVPLIQGILTQLSEGLSIAWRGANMKAHIVGRRIFRVQHAAVGQRPLPQKKWPSQSSLARITSTPAVIDSSADPVRQSLQP